MIALAVSQGFAQIAGIDGCGSVGEAGPILSLELARDAADAARLLGGDACRDAQRTGLWLDVIGFIPAYTLFIVIAARALFGEAPRLARIAIAATIGAALADYVEDALLFDAIDAMAISFALLRTMVVTKFALLAFAELVLGVALVRGGAWPGRIVGAAIGAGAAVALATLAIDPYARWMFAGNALALAALLAIALLAAFRPALAVRPAQV